MYKIIAGTRRFICNAVLVFNWMTVFAVKWLLRESTDCFPEAGFLKDNFDENAIQDTVAFSSVPEAEIEFNGTH
jgi:hypothetical protein